MAHIAFTGMFNVAIDACAKQVMHQQSRVQVRDTKAMKLAPRWQGPPQQFGSAYTCSLTDTVTEARPCTHLLVRGCILLCSNM